MEKEKFAAALGVGDMSGMEALMYGNLEDDEELMAELLALENGEEASSEPQRKAKAPPVTKKRPAVADSNVDKLVRQMGDEATLQDEEDGSSADVDDDPALLGELKELLSGGDDTASSCLSIPAAAVSSAPAATPSQPTSAANLESTRTLLSERSENYNEAVLVPVPVERPQAASPKDVPTKAHASVSPSQNDQNLSLLITRRDEYKMAAVRAKTAGDKSAAIKFYKTAKQFDAAVEAVKNGENFDISTIPPAPPRLSVVQEKSAEPLPVAKEEAPPAAGSSVSTKPTTTLEALEQRLEKYKETAKKTKEEGNDRRARQSERIAKQYQEAIRATKSRKPYNYDELPVPPGFGPIPLASAAAPQPLAPAGGPAKRSPQPAQPSAVVRPQVSAAVGPSPPKQSRQEQQLQLLRHRQAQFKEAALAAKQKGDTELAKKFLRQAKGFDQMILASENGVRVDLSNIPTPPQAKSSAAALRPLVQNEPTTGSSKVQDRVEVFGTLEKDLIRQIQICERNQEHFTGLGDVSQVNKYERMALTCRKDLVALRQAAKMREPVPRFRYETRVFPSLRCCPDLGDDDFEVAIIRALAVPLPDGYEEKHADVFVRYELPFQDSPQHGKTASVKDTVNPEFNERFKLRVNRKSRAFQRYVKRHGIKFEVFQRGGFLRCDRSLASCELKLQPFEDEAEQHVSLDLMEGRKAVGGKLEIKARIREPFVNKQAELSKEKWLVIDEFLTNRRPAAESRPTAVVSSSGKVVLPQIPIGSCPTVQQPQQRRQPASSAAPFAQRQR